MSGRHGNLFGGACHNDWATPKAVAVRMVALAMSLNPTAIAVDPCVGRFAPFYSAMPKTKRIGIELNPAYAAEAGRDVLVQSFFDFSPAEGSFTVVGNPPYGGLATPFINHALTFAEYAVVLQ